MLLMLNVKLGHQQVFWIYINTRARVLNVPFFLSPSFSVSNFNNNDIN